MALDDAHLAYPQRRYGMDHERYAWSMLTQRRPVVWPGGKTLAVWVNLSLEHFPLNPVGKPVKLPGSMTMPYPDLRHYTLRDYGNRVGIFRMLRALDQAGVRPSFAINSDLVARYPYLVREIAARCQGGGGEVLGHSWSMDTPHAGGLNETDEAALVARSLLTLRQAFEGPVRGWLSPGRLESARTPELIKAHGIDYFCDWVNDELPYAFHTSHGDLWAMPLASEIEDRFVLLDNFHSEASWAEQVTDAFDLLRDEARTQGGRIFSLSLHPWVMGQPHRIKHLEAVLAHITGHSDVWTALPGQIVDAFSAQQLAAAGAAP